MKMKRLLVGFGVVAALVCFAPKRVWPTVSNTVVETTTGFGDGSTTTFSITFDFRSNSWITVTEYDTSTIPTTVTTIPQGSGAGKFSVSGGNPGTAIVMGTAPSLTQYLIIGRSIPLTQPVVFNPASIFPYQGLSSQLDQVTLTLQNLNAFGGGQGGGGGGGGGGGTPNFPVGMGFNLLGYDSTGASVVNYPDLTMTDYTDLYLYWSGSTWGAVHTADILSRMNSQSGVQLTSNAGGSGTNNGGNLAWGSNNLTFTTTGVTNVTLPSTGTLIAGTVDNNNTANAIVKRDSSGNFSSNVVTANSFVGPVTGAVTGNVTGNVTGTAANVTGIVAIGNGGTGQTTRQNAINALLNSSGGSAGQFARYDGSNVSLSAILVGDVPQGFSRLKLAQDTPNTLIINDGSGNMSVLPGGTAGYVATFDGVKWVSGPQGTGLPGIFPYGADTGSANAYVVATPNPPITSYQPGIGVSFIAANANTTAATLNVGGLGVKNITHADLTSLTANDILAGKMVVVQYDGTEFQLINPPGGTTAAAGSNTNVQYKSAGAFAGNSGFVYDGSGSVTVTAGLNSSTVNVTSLTASKPVFTDGSKNLVSGSVSGNTTKVASTTGTLTSGDCVSIDASGNFVDNGGACGSGLSFIDSLTQSGNNVLLVNDASSPGNSQYYGTNSSGTKGYFSLPTGFSNPMTTLGDMMYENNTPAAARLAGNITTQTKYLMQVGTGAVSAAPQWVQPNFNQISGNASVVQGGTGLTTLTSHAVLVGAGTSAVTPVGPDASTTKVLTAAGASADPSFQNPTLAVQGQYDSGTSSASTMVVPYNQLTKTATGVYLAETGNKNLLLNASFENSTFSTSWTVTTATGSVETTNIADGRQSAKLVYSSQTGGIAQSVTPTVQTNAVNYEASCKVNTTFITMEVCGLAGGTKQNCTAVPSSGTWQTVTANFVGPANGTSVGINIDTTTSGSGTVYVDDCYVGPARNLGTSSVNTQWATYTPVFTGMGTVSTQSFWWRRMGDTLQIKGTFTPGTTTATEARISYPNSYVADSTKMSAAIELCGSFARGNVGGSQNTLSTLCEASQAYMTFGIYTGGTAYGTSSPLTKMLGNDLLSANPESLFMQVPVTAFTDQSIYRPDSTPASWSGYHDNTCSWSTTSATFVDPSDDASCGFTQRTNRNFGTVVTSGASKPGIVWTPPRAGRYQVCASVTGQNSASNRNLMQLTDGTTAFMTGIQNGQAQPLGASICGIQNVTTVASTTTKLQMAADGGTFTIASGSTIVNSIEWSIFELDAPMPAPYLTGSITSNDPAKAYRVESARINNNGTCTIGSQSGTWVQSAAHQSTGQCALNITGAFSAAPVCTCNQTDSTSYICQWPIAATSTSIEFETDTGAGSGADRPVNIICMGPR